MYKIVFIDIDGTLMNDKKQITKKTRDIINKLSNKGIIVVICSGRAREYAINISKEINFSNYIISSNGGEVFDYRNNKIIYENEIDNDTIISLYNVVESYDASIIMNTNNGRVTNKRTKSECKIMENKISDFLKDNKVVQLVIVDDDLEKIQRIKKELDKYSDLKIVNASKWLYNKKVKITKSTFIDIANKDTCKGEAVRKLCNYLNIELNKAIALGDSYNDLSMFEIVGKSVAMGNATEDIKSAVNEVTLTNNNDGVATFLEKQFLK